MAQCLIISAGASGVFNRFNGLLDQLKTEDDIPHREAKASGHARSLRVSASSSLIEHLRLVTGTERVGGPHIKN